MACCQGDGGPPDRRAWGQPSSWPPSALPLAPGHDLDVAATWAQPISRRCPSCQGRLTRQEEAGVNCRPRKSPLRWTRGSPNVMNNNAQAAVGHGCPQAVRGGEDPGGRRRPRSSACPQSHREPHRREDGQEAPTQGCVRGAGLCAPASPFLAQWGRLTESPPGSSQAARAGDSQYTRPAAPSPSLSSRLHAPGSWSRAGSNADPALWPAGGLPRAPPGSVAGATSLLPLRLPR